MADNKSSYHIIIPATVRHDKRLKFGARLLYGEIMAMANIKGYCKEQNNYFAELYSIRMETISRWISELKLFKYIDIQMINDKITGFIERRIYINNILT